MPYYPSLLDLPEETRKRTGHNLLRLREHLRTEIPDRTVRDTLVLATWNIRDFGVRRSSRNQRLPESYFYIAEILSAFDLVTIQEVGRDLTALRKVKEILGPSWAYFIADTSGGWRYNPHGLGFLYDRRKVQFQDMAGQIVLQEGELILGKYQFTRPPFITMFRSGWFEFIICAVHIFFGSGHGEDLAHRVAEIDMISKIMSRRAKQEESNVILLGDFNIVNPQHETMQALIQYGFTIPPELQKPSNFLETRYFSQIAFLVKENQLQLGSSNPPAGVFNFFNAVFREEEAKTYIDLGDWAGQETQGPNAERKYKFWRTSQISDHLPLWVELKIDFSDQTLLQMRESV
jgi:exonuclease III